MRSDGNGNYVLSKKSAISIGLAIVIITALVGFAAHAAGQAQMVRDHIGDTNIHHSATELNKSFIPRDELEAELDWIKASLTRIESRIDRSDK